MDSEEHIFYVGIREPIESRRALLDCSKELIKALQRYERFKATRADKARSIIELKNIMLELNKLNLELKDKLPKGVGVISRERNRKENKNISPLYKKERSDLDKLENELNLIEKKLGALGRQK